MFYTLALGLKPHLVQFGEVFWVFPFGFGLFVPQLQVMAIFRIVELFYYKINKDSGINIKLLF